MKRTEKDFNRIEEMRVKPRIKKRMKVLRNINLFRKRRKRNCYRQVRRDRKKMLLRRKKD